MTIERRRTSDRDPEDLVRRYVAEPSNDLRDAIVAVYTPLIELTARRYARMEPMEDLVQVGYLGLLNALRKFDPASGVKFGTYATYLVAGEMKHYLRDRSQTIRQPAWLQELRHKVNRERANLQALLGRAPTEAELAERLGCPIESIVEVATTEETLRVGSLDEHVDYNDGSGDSEPMDLGMPTEGLSPEERLALEDAIGQLKELERKVVIGVHFEALSQTELAQRLGISGNYVSYLLRQALAKLRRILIAEASETRQAMATHGEEPAWDEELEVYTEAYFRARLQEEILRAADYHQTLGLIFIDLSHAVAKAHTLPNVSGEYVMSEMAARVRARVRRTDIVARYGQHGFAVILPGAGAHTPVIEARLMAVLDEAITDQFGTADGFRAQCSVMEFPVDFQNYRQFLATEKSALGVA